MCQHAHKTFESDRLKLIFFGLGSIGSRLARLVRDNFNHDLYTFRTEKEHPNDLGIDEIYELDKIEHLSADIAFITNPTSFHMETAIQSAKMGMHLFIEKPLCNNLEELNTLLEVVREKNIFTYVACNMRFDPIIQYLKENLDLDRFFYSRVTCSSNLEEWKPQQDYRLSYSAKRDLGGGVVLDLIHEPDYCHWLFGRIASINGYAGRCSKLEIETEDYADIQLNHSSGLISNLHLDYFGHKPQRKIEVFGDGIYMEADLIDRKITTVTEDGEDINEFESIDRDYTYKKELEYFFQCLNQNENPMNNVEEHITVLRPLLAFKNSHLL